MRKHIVHAVLLAIVTAYLAAPGSAEASNYLAGQSSPQNNSWAGKNESTDPPVSYNSYQAGFYGAWYTYGTANRGTLFNQTGTSGGVPWNFRGFASFRFNDLVFTCADGRSSVTYRARVGLSAQVIQSAGTGTGPASFYIGDPSCAWGSCTGSTWGGWSSKTGGTGSLAGLLAGSGFPTTVIIGPARTVPTGVSGTLSLGLGSTANSYNVPGGYRNLRIITNASLPVGSPVFELPEGCSCNSAEGNIVDNMWMGVDLPPATVSVSGTVTSDCGGPMAGVTVNLVDGNGTSMSTTTAADGTYSFAEVASSATEDGTIEIIAPTGYDAVDHAFISLDTDTMFDATLMCTVVDVTGTVSSDCDGPVEGVDVTLTDGNSGTTTVATDSEGAYSFAGILYNPNPAQVSIAVPAGYSAQVGSSAAIDLTTGGTQDFVLACIYVNVAGTISSDCDGPVEGVDVTLTDGDGGTTTTATGPDGAYAFTGIRYDANPAQVSMTVPVGYLAPGGTSAAIDMTTGGTQDFALICALVDVTGAVSSACSGALSGVTVDLLDAGGEFYTTTTDAYGNYAFMDLPYSTEVGGGEVSIAIPLGYEAITPGVQGAALTLDQDQAVNFSLGCLNPSGDPRSMGYWKHQANVYLSGKGNAQESSTDMSATFPQALFSHFYENQLNGIEVEGVTYIVSGGNDVPTDLETIQNTLTVSKGGTTLDRAKQHYLALLLNVASGKLLTSAIVSTDGATVSQALQQVAVYILDGASGNDEAAKDIGEIINNAGTVPAGMIDLNISSIAYRRGGPENGTLLLGAAPSPFRSATSIQFRLDAPGDASVDVFDAMGRLVRNIHYGWTDAGPHEVTWGGQDEDGRAVVSGVYYIRLVSGGRSLIRTAVLVR